MVGPFGLLFLTVSGVSLMVEAVETVIEAVET
jgi:hypothetical protein